MVQIAKKNEFLIGERDSTNSAHFLLCLGNIIQHCQFFKETKLFDESGRDTIKDGKGQSTCP